MPPPHLHQSVDAHLLDYQGETEMSREDNKRHRNRMKRISSKRRRQAPKSVDITKLRGVKKGQSSSVADASASTGGHAYKSGQFFQHLQTQVQSQKPNEKVKKSPQDGGRPVSVATHLKL